MVNINVLIGLLLSSALGASAAWQTLAPGLDLRTLTTVESSYVGDSKITVLRVDPKLWNLEFVGINQTGESVGRTARAWCRKHRLVAAINAGMFGADYKTHLGYLRFRDRVYSSRVNSYQSVAAFDPRDGSNVPPFRIFDLDAPGVTMKRILRDYCSAIQNLRLVKRPGRNVWSRQDRQWSEAALGEDKDGRILLICCRSPFSMYDLNQELLKSDLGLVAAQHLEGGPEVQLYLRVGKVERELFGSFETLFKENDLNPIAWPIPNVLGIRAKGIESKR